MQHFFWDTGVLIGYSLYFDKKELQALGIWNVQIDASNEDCKCFVDYAKDSTNVISSFTYRIELNLVVKKIKKRVKLLLSQVDEKYEKNNDFFHQFTRDDWKWVDEKRGLFTEANKIGLVNFFTDLVAVMESRIDFLLKTYVKDNIHKDYVKPIQTKLFTSIRSKQDSIIFATCMDYHNNKNEATFVTTDKKDYSKITAWTQIDGASIPPISYVYDYLEE